MAEHRCSPRHYRLSDRGFEDATLIPSLQIQLSGGSASYGPTSTLPHTFHPLFDDPNAPAWVFVPGTWDGTNVLMNRRNAPLPVGYVDSEWADITFVLPAGALSLGFSVEQLEVANTILSVTSNNGTAFFNLSNIPNFVVGSGRNGYLRIDADAGETILSAKIDNLSGDGIAFDHAAVKVVPETSSVLLLLSGAAGFAFNRRNARNRNT